MVRRRRPDDNVLVPRNQEDRPLPLAPNISGLELMALLLKQP